MTVEEAARYLFVSRAHVHRLLASGILRATVGDNGEYIIDDVTVENRAKELRRARDEYLRSRTEDNDPLGL